MAATAGSTIITYPISDTLNNLAVQESLQAELEALTLLELVFETVDIVATTIKVGCSYSPGNGAASFDADLTTIAAAIAAHEGEPIGVDFQKVSNNVDDVHAGVVVDATSTELVTPPLKAGEYLIHWTCEAESTDAATDGSLEFELFGTAKGTENFSGVFRRVIGCSDASTRTAGSKVTARININVAAGAVTLRNRRIEVSKVL